MEEIEKNIEISGTSQITFGRDDNSGHTVEAFHIYEDQVEDPKNKNNKVKAKILCVIDSDTICLVEVGERGAPCKPFEFTTKRDSEMGLQKLTMTILPEVFIAPTRW